MINQCYNLLSDDLLSQLAHKYNASKRLHTYMPVYNFLFNNIRLDVKKVLEIGVQTGGSLKMWKDYFPNAIIYGIDIDPLCKSKEENRIEILIGNSNNVNFLKTVPNNLDIIIDDGDHRPESQTGLFEFLFRYNLNNLGIYIIEDIMSKKATEYFSNLSMNLNFWPKNFQGRNWPRLNTFNTYEEATWFDKNIIGVLMFRYLCFILKGKNPEDGEAQIRIGPC